MGTAALAPLLLSLGAATSTAAAPSFDRVGAAVEAAIAAGEIPGAVVLIGRGDEVLYERAFGARALVPTREVMTLDTLFDLASVTKSLSTAVAVMALVERGQVALDAPVGRYLPELRAPRFEGVTIERLLTHTAGFAADPKPTDELSTSPARALAKERLLRAPGTKFEYSDTGFMLLGLVVERVSGRPLDRFLAELYAPLHLESAGYRPPRALLPRIAPTTVELGVPVRGTVHDGNARRLGGVAGHAGLFATARDVSRVLRMLLAGGALDGARVLEPETVARMWTPNADGRALGWDSTSTYAARFAPYFPAGSVGHTGFTGPSIWADPASKTYVVLLTHHLHPKDQGPQAMLALRERVMAEAAAELFVAPFEARQAARALAEDLASPARATKTATGAAAGPVRTGLAVLAASGFARLRGHTIGLVTNQSGIDASRRRTIDLLASAPGVKLAAIFAPEHGIEGKEDRLLPDARDPVTRLPIYSLYGRALKPTGAMLEGIDLLVFDVQDVGARYYTYLATLLYVLEAGARTHLPVVVLDRPNPIGGEVVEGPLLDPDRVSFTAPHTLPVRTGLTIGEYARLVAAEKALAVDLTVVPMEGWSRARWYDETGLPWVSPSPNVRSVTEALLYAGIGLLEATNLSVGRGTDTPFEVLGAPWVDGEKVAAWLAARPLPGVRFHPVRFTPSSAVFARQRCSGVRIEVTDRDQLRPVTAALSIARALAAVHGPVFRAERMQHLLGNRAVLGAFLRGEPVERLVARMDADVQAFLRRRAPFLLYR